MSWHLILGVSRSAPYPDVRAAFKRKVLETHPDKGGSAQDFRRVMLAFEKAALEATGARAIPVAAASAARRGAHSGSGSCFAASAKRAEGRSGRAAAGVASGLGGSRSVRRKSVEAIMERLHSLLSKLQRHDRKMAIATKLQERHRVALETWLQHVAWRKKEECREESKTKSCDHSNPAFEEETSFSEEEILALEDVPQETKLPPKTASKGIIRRPGRVKLYCVIVVINNLELFAGGTTDLARAVDVHMALTSLKQRILKSPALWEKLPEALDSSMSEHDLLLREARLSFRVHFPVHHWTGSGLRSPTYPISRLQSGMVIWQKLQQSRLQYSGLGAKRGGVFYQHTPAAVEEAWQKISQIFIDIWVESGCNEAKIRRKLESMRKRHEQQHHCQLAAWNAYRMAKEERRQQLCARVMRRWEERERRHLEREDRRALQVASFTSRVVGQIERLIQRWDKIWNSRSKKFKKTHRFAPRKGWQRQRLVLASPAFSFSRVFCRSCAKPEVSLNAGSSWRS
ncbi:Prolyl-tRNA synthetase [Durusdinium trenchii]|uniref:Prolyl-tRNA synthetase n=1 Tax=Durusdinium trenchii TaxID=1381693 RepID=A0ABP0NK21_9DINO